MTTNNIDFRHQSTYFQLVTNTFAALLLAGNTINAVIKRVCKHCVDFQITNQSLPEYITKVKIKLV